MAGAPRVAVISLASDFGCQVQITNIDPGLLQVLGLIDLRYWQLTSSGHMPDEYDVAVIEGAVTTEGHIELLQQVREKASIVVAIGSCAVTGGIPALAGSIDEACRFAAVYGEDATVTPGLCSPVAISRYIDVDYIVPGCPIDTTEFLAVLGRAIKGLSNGMPEQPLCASCKTHGNECFMQQGVLCLGMVTRSGCDAKCTTLGRSCTGCRGLAPDANLASAQKVYAAFGHDFEEVVAAMDLYNTDREVCR